MISSFDQIDVLQKQLEALKPMKPEDQQRLDKKFRLEFNYNSNHLEGNTLTYGETELLLIFDDTKGNHTMREYEEMKAHDVAYHLVEDWAKDKERPLTEQSIKELNEVILVRPYWKEAETTDGQATRRQIKVGEYKEHPNSVRLQNGEMFHYASPTDTPIKMQELMDWYRKDEQLHPVALAALMHYKFVCIHPFDDGNGRVSRLLMNYVLLSNNLPPVIIKSEDKANYLRALHLADVGDIAAFTEYIAQQVIWSLKISIKAAQGESIDEAGDVLKEISLLSKKLEGASAYSKSPKLIYNIYQQVNSMVLSGMKEEIEKFSNFFYELKLSKFYNGLTEPLEKKSIIPEILQGKVVNPNAVLIFGRDIYERDVETLEWKLKIFGLKNAKGKSSFETSIKVSFQKSNYVLSIYLDKIQILNIEKLYNMDVEAEELNNAKELYSKQFLIEIKKSMQEE